MSPHSCACKKIPPQLELKQTKLIISYTRMYIHTFQYGPYHFPSHLIMSTRIKYIITTQIKTIQTHLIVHTHVSM